MDISKIKDYIKSKPTWVKVLVSIISIFICGISVWFGLDSCASLELDKLNVNTDKVDVNVEGVIVHPKDVSFIYRLEDFS